MSKTHLFKAVNYVTGPGHVEIVECNEGRTVPGSRAVVDATEDAEGCTEPWASADHVYFDSEEDAHEFLVAHARRRLDSAKFEVRAAKADVSLHSEYLGRRRT